jgi:hypothetical protein
LGREKSGAAVPSGSMVLGVRTIGRVSGGLMGRNGDLKGKRVNVGRESAVVEP